MLIKKIEYTDYDGNKRIDECCFHLNKAELIKWISSTNGYSIEKLLKRLMKERNIKEIIKIFEDLVHMSYGKKSLDGRRFEKSEEIWEDFSQTEAYSILFMELISDADKAAEFVNGIVPSDLASDVDKMMENKEVKELMAEFEVLEGTNEE